MSLRPLEARQPPERGGDGPRRRWSESPIPRPGRRRVRMVGTESTTPPTPPEGGRYDYTAMLGASGTYDLNGLLLPESNPDAGAVLVLLAVGGQTVTPPAGWATLASGANGPQNYWLGWLRCTGTDDLDLPFSGGNWDTVGHLGIVQYPPMDAAWDVVATSATTSTAASVTVPAADPAWENPSMLVGMYCAVGNYGLYYTEDAGISGGSHSWYGIYDGGAGVWHLLDVAPTTAADIDYWTNSSHTTPTTDNASVAFAFGFVAP